jgi:hypothetical protein
MNKFGFKRFKNDVVFKILMTGASKKKSDEKE